MLRFHAHCRRLFSAADTPPLPRVTPICGLRAAVFADARCYALCCYCSPPLLILPPLAAAIAAIITPHFSDAIFRR